MWGHSAVFWLFWLCALGGMGVVVMMFALNVREHRARERIRALRGREASRDAAIREMEAHARRVLKDAAAWRADVVDLEEYRRARR